MKTFTYRRLQCFLLLPALLHNKTCHGELSNINPGSLRGAYLDAETGLTDKQLALANWLLEQANATLDDGSWDWAPYGNQGLAQFGLTSTRYAISFTALAHALQATEATPAYSEVAEEALALAVRRLEDPSVFFYWGYTGHCGPSWNQRICEAHNFSMCDEDAWLWQDHPEQLPPQGLSCPDPVGFGNIMFSAHVAQTLLLYQLVSGKDASEVAWASSDGRFRYGVSEVVEALARQAAANGKVGGGITCEPGNVYPSCNGHHFGAYRLYSALNDGGGGGSVGSDDGGGSGGGGVDYEKLRDGWREYLLHTNAASGPGPFWSGMDVTGGGSSDGRYGEQLFRVTQAMPRLGEKLGRPELEFSLPLGCAPHDLWVMVMLQAWNDVDGLSWLNATVGHMAGHPGWKDSQQEGGGSFLQDARCSSEAMLPDTMDLATAFFAFAERQLGKESEGSTPALWEERTAAVYTWFEGRAVVSSAGDALHYASDNETEHAYHEEVLNAAVVAASMASAGGALPALFGPEGVARFDRRKPRLASVPRPEVLVRLAKWEAALAYGHKKGKDGKEG